MVAALRRHRLVHRDPCQGDTVRALLATAPDLKIRSACRRWLGIQLAGIGGCPWGMS